MKNNKGFTLVEMMWVISLMVIVIVAIYSIYEGSMNLYYISSEQGIAQGEARKSMRLMTQHLRGMQLINEVDVDGYSITFNSDIDDDKIGERISYTVDGTTLVYSMIDDGISIRIAQYVRNEELGIPLFEFYNRDGEKLNDSGSIIAAAYYVDIRIITDVTVDNIPGTRPDRYELKSSIQFRNRDI